MTHDVGVAKLLVIWKHGLGSVLSREWTWHIQRLEFNEPSAENVLTVMQNV